MARGKHRVVVLGGGAGGLELVTGLARHNWLDVTLVDRVGFHLWKPRLHEFAAGTVNSILSEMSFHILSQMRGFRFELGHVGAIDRQARKVELQPIKGPDGQELAAARSVPYDYCVIALGGVTPDFGTPGVAEHAIRLDQKSDADAFRTEFVALMIQARETRRPVHVVIIGSGATGTELAAHLRRSELAFADREPSDRKDKLLDITILEAADRIMPGAHEDIRGKVLQRLKALDIAVVTEAKVTAVEAGRVVAASGQEWPAEATVWAAGLVGTPALRRLADFEFDRNGRIKVDGHLRTTVDERIYAIGDAASVSTGDGGVLAPTAQVASQQAGWLAKALPELAYDDGLDPFVYHDKGWLLSLGGAGAVGRVGLGPRDDLLIEGHFARAAYQGLQRKHQWAVLGPMRGSVAILADMISPTQGPALKLHG